MNKRLIIISFFKKRNACYLNKTHKFGTEVHKSVAQAYALDERNGNTLWANVISKGMKFVSIYFRKLDNWEIFPLGYQHVNCHMIFDVKMDDFCNKARLEAGGHVTNTPSTITYAIIVFREKVRIALTLDALNDFPVKAAEI